jgi:hypothetical protein
MEVDRFDIVDHAIPAFGDGEIAGMISVRPMPTMIMSADGIVTFDCRGGEALIAISILTEAMHDLQDASAIARRLPELRVNLVTVVGGQNLSTVLYHWAIS